MTVSTPKILLIDDHEIFSAGLSMLMEEHFARSAILSARSGAEALDLFAQHSGFLLLVVDFHLPDTTGVELIESLRAKDPEVPIAMLTASQDAGLRDKAYRVGANMCLGKHLDARAILQRLAEMVRDLMGDAAWPRQRDASGLFTERQLDVLDALCKGLSNKQICRDLEISEPTVKTHLAEIYRNLGVGNRTSAVVEATRRNVLRSRV